MKIKIPTHIKSLTRQLSSKFLRKRSNAKLLWLQYLLLLFFFLSLLFTNYSSTGNSQSPPPPPPVNHCLGRYIYIHNLPTKFNSDLLSSCHNLSQWTDMCRFISNSGLGPRIGETGTSWYNTNQFALELIFHNRMKTYDCLTRNSSLASAIYVPFYAGLDIGRHLWGYNSTVRDALSLDLVRWLTAQPEWGVMNGRDHFLVAGRITWDFRRLSEYGDWGSKFFLMPETKNMTVLVIESSPWHREDIAVPYPTYFHPSTKSEIVGWQERVRRMERPWLFSFAGAPRPNMTGSIRGALIEQCRASRHCKLLDCHAGASQCHSPGSVIEMFQRSVFCLQPLGDSYTRRSAFDSMVAGCIPVFFHPGTAYVQYVWHLPRNYTTYSVFIPEGGVRSGEVSVEEVLGRFDEEEVRRMREEVVRLIPSLIYNNPRVRVEGVEDAFDVAVDRVIRRVEKIRVSSRLSTLGFGDGGDGDDHDEHNSWKEGLVDGGGKHEWDHFFV